MEQRQYGTAVKILRIILLALVVLNVELAIYRYASRGFFDISTAVKTPCLLIFSFFLLKNKPQLGTVKCKLQKASLGLPSKNSYLNLTIVAPQLPINSGALLNDSTKSVRSKTRLTISFCTPTPLP